MSEGMSESELPRREDPEHGQHVEQDEPTLDQPEDKSETPDEPAEEVDPAHAPARQLRPG
jgi:hypothetical protein